MPITAAPQITVTREAIPTDNLVDGIRALLSIGFSAHDDRLRVCCKSGLSSVERYTGLLLYPATVTVRYAQLYDYEELPHGPVTGEVIATGLTGNAITHVLTTGQHPQLIGDYPDGVALSYNAGYELNEWPEAIKEAVLMAAAEQFDGMKRNWKALAADFRRTTWAS